MTPLIGSAGTIAVPTQEIGRFTLFTVCLYGTERPVLTNLAIRASVSVTENLNSVIRDLRDDDMWLWVLGDDHSWEPDALVRMLVTMDENPDIDVLVPLVVKRNPPWHLVVFHETDDVNEDGVQAWLPYRWDEVPETGVFEIDAAGSAGMLIRRATLDAIGDPWFGSTTGMVLNEDVIFCQKARDLGFRIFATADVSMGHIGVFNVSPRYRDGRWGAMAEFSSPEEQYRHLFMPDLLEPHPVVVNGR